MTSKLYADARWRPEGADRLERAIERVEVVNWQSSGGAEAIAMRLSSKRRLQCLPANDSGGDMIVIIADDARVNKTMYILILAL